MYRYSVDNAVTSTPDDFVLYRESPFAIWMERLTLENPDHGIPPDIGSDVPASSAERQDDLAETLREEGRDVALIDWEMDEPRRRTATLEAMRRGADFVVNGQLGLGPLQQSLPAPRRPQGRPTRVRSPRRPLPAAHRGKDHADPAPPALARARHAGIVQRQEQVVIGAYTACRNRRRRSKLITGCFAMVRRSQCGVDASARAGRHVERQRTQVGCRRNEQRDAR